jgi:adenylate kinase
VFEGHSLIDGRDGLLEIPSTVFAALSLDAIAFLAADAAAIFERRRLDTGREHPTR